MTVVPASILFLPGAAVPSFAYTPLLRRVVERIQPRPVRVLMHTRVTGSSLAEDVAQVMGRIRERGGRCLVVGHSMGAFTAEALMRLHPGAVMGLVLLDPSVAEELSPEEMAEYDLECFERSAFGRRPRPEDENPVARMRADLGRYRPDERALLRLRRKVPHLPDVPVVVLSAALGRVTSRQRQWLGLQSLLVSQLRRDHPGRLASVVARELVPCGHAVMLWRPRTVVDAVAGVLARSDGSGPGARRRRS